MGDIKGATDVKFIERDAFVKEKQAELAELEVILEMWTDPKRVNVAGKSVTAIISKLKKQRQSLIDILAILNEGFRPIKFPLPKDWIEGEAIRNPMPYSWLRRFTSTWISLLGLILASLINGDSRFIFIGLPMAAILLVIGYLADGKYRNILFGCGLDPNEEHFFFKGEILPASQQALAAAKASGLFDRTFKLLAPKEAFERVAASVDPIIIGKRHGVIFVVSQFEMGVPPELTQSQN